MTKKIYDVLTVISVLVLVFVIGLFIMFIAKTPLTFKNVGEGIPNPWHTTQSLDEAQDEVGFSVQVPYEIKDDIRYIPDRTVEIYSEIDNNALTYRKSAEINPDISGDYTKYNFNERVDNITLKGYEPDLIKLAIWQEDGFSYALMSSVAIPKTEMLDLVKKYQEA